MQVGSRQGVRISQDLGWSQAHSRALEASRSHPHMKSRTYPQDAGGGAVCLSSHPTLPLVTVVTSEP